MGEPTNKERIDEEDSKPSGKPEEMKAAGQSGSQSEEEQGVKKGGEKKSPSDESGRS
jgi:hypothetical protein